MTSERVSARRRLRPATGMDFEDVGATGEMEPHTDTVVKVATRAIDPKWLEKPSVFDGRAEGWRAWKLKVES